MRCIHLDDKKVQRKEKKWKIWINVFFSLYGTGGIQSRIELHPVLIEEAEKKKTCLVAIVLTQVKELNAGVLKLKT